MGVGWPVFMQKVRLATMFWLYNLPSNLFVPNERQMLTTVFLDQNSGPK